MEPLFDVSVERAFQQNQEAVLLKLSNRFAECNVYITPAEASQIAAFARGEAHCISAGNAANSPVHWDRTDNAVYLLIGHDRDTWDIGFLLDEETMTLIRQSMHAMPSSGR